MWYYNIYIERRDTQDEKKRIKVLLIAALTASALGTGCGGAGTVQGETVPESVAQVESAYSQAVPGTDVKTNVITPDTEIRQLENGLSAVRYDGDDWFSRFLEQGGASTDSEVVGFITGQLQLGAADIGFETEGFGCSTLAVKIERVRRSLEGTLIGKTVRL